MGLTMITKEKSTELKGVAILMMIFLHLFNKPSNVQLCECFLYVGDVPLVYWLSGAANSVVAIYLILSGYGHYYTVNKPKSGGGKKRLYKLYVHWWVVLAFFVGLGSLFYPDRYPGGFAKLISNVTGWHTTYYGEAWFLFPYVLISISSHWLFRMLEYLGSIKTLLIAGLLNLATSYLISRYGSTYLFDNMLLYLPVLFVSFWFSFYIGAVACSLSQRSAMPSVCPAKKHVLLLVSSLCALVALRSIFPSAAWGPEYAASLIFLLVHVPLPRLGARMLRFLGKHSMTMWFTHAWFCYYLFHDFTYSLRHPLLIFLFVVLASLLSAMLVERIADWIYRKSLPVLFH